MLAVTVVLYGVLYLKGPSRGFEIQKMEKLTVAGTDHVPQFSSLSSSFPYIDALTCVIASDPSSVERVPCVLRHKKNAPDMVVRGVLV